MMTEYWAHYYAENPNAQDEVVDEDFDLDNEIARIEADADNVDDWEDLT